MSFPVTRRALLVGRLWNAGAARGRPAARYPLTVTHKYGDTEIRREPSRVVTVGLSDQDHGLALRVVPVGVTDWYGEQPDAVWPWARDALGDAKPEVMPRNDDELDFEPRT